MRLDEFWRRVAFLIHRTKRLAEMDEEMRLHAELRTRELQRQSMAEVPAAIAAQRQFGNRTSFKEAVWDVWSFAPLENAWRDLKFGARLLRASPGFTILAILTLALGIGATTAMFSVVDNVLLEPFPYADQQRIFSIVIHDLSSNEAGDRTVFPASEFLDYKEQNRVFDDMMGVTSNRALWTINGAPESVSAPLVTANAFQFLGVPPLLGRYVTPSDIKPGATPVCVMSYSFWKGQFAGDADVVGKVLILDGTPTTVIGAMPARFGLWSADVWIPITLRRGQAGLRPPWFYLLGRLRTGITVKSADHEIQLLAERLAPLYRPNLYTNKFRVTLQSFVNASTEKVGRTLYTYWPLSACYY